MFNAHLFERLDVQRYGSTEIESIPTDELLAYKSTLECAEQIAPDGVELSWTDFESHHKLGAARAFQCCEPGDLCYR